MLLHAPGVLFPPIFFVAVAMATKNPVVLYFLEDGGRWGDEEADWVVSAGTFLPTSSPDPHASPTGVGPASVHSGQAAYVGSFAGPWLPPGSLISLRKVLHMPPRLRLNGPLIPGGILFPSFSLPFSSIIP